MTMLIRFRGYFNEVGIIFRQGLRTFCIHCNQGSPCVLVALDNPGVLDCLGVGPERQGVLDCVTGN